MSIMRDLASGLDADTVVNREALKYAVQRQITCPQTGKVLDVRRCVVLEFTPTEGRTSSIAVDAGWSDENMPAIREASEARGITVTVLDGRILFAKGRK